MTPPAYLKSIGILPRTIAEGLKLVGTHEKVGPGSNPEILRWRDELNAAGVKIEGYSDDDIAWCGLLAAIVAHRAGKAVVKEPLWARNWLDFGKPVATPGLGDVLVFSRGKGGHVGFYVGEDEWAYHVLGGNQGNEVSVTRVLKSRLLGARRPVYRQQPESVKPYRLSAEGALSKNEA
jgi:uncharacterized protein (TIGR02594 family)